MQNDVGRIIIDTNLWISFLITKDFTKLDEIFFQKEVFQFLAKNLVDEFLEVVKRPKFRRFFSSDDIEELLETIEEFADFVNIESQVEICRDSKDNFLLSLSIDGKADFLLNGDKDLLVLTKFGETSIITISEFLKEK